MRHTNETIAAETLTGSLRGEEYADCTFTRCRWQDLRVENCSFANCTFAGCQWSGVVFSFTQMREGRFTGCAFRGIAWGGLQGKSALAPAAGGGRKLHVPVQRLFRHGAGGVRLFQLPVPGLPV